MAAAGVIVFAAGLIQGFTGFGYSVLTVPVLRLIHPALAPIPQILIGVTLALAGAWRERSDVNTTGMGAIIVGRIPGALAGAWLVGFVAMRILDLVTALIVLGGVAVLLTDVRVRQTEASRFLIGAVSGFAGTASAMSGPPLALFYQSNGRSEARSSLGVLFFLGGLVSVAALLVNGTMDWAHLQIAAFLEVPTILGFMVSSHWINQVDESRLRNAVLATSALAGGMLVLRALGWL